MLGQFLPIRRNEVVGLRFPVAGSAVEMGCRGMGNGIRI